MPLPVADRSVATRVVRYAPSVEDLLAGGSHREAWKTADSLSGSHLERLVMGGERHVVKYVCVDDDWIMRATGDLHCRQLTLLKSGVLEALPDAVDHTIVGCAPFTSSRGHRGAALLMRDVSEGMVPPGDQPIALQLHRQFLDHMALMHATYLGAADGDYLFPFAHHYTLLTPTMAALEAAAGGSAPVPVAVAAGWRLMADRHPRQARVLGDLARDPGPLLAALRTGPVSLLQGDWKFGNLGTAGEVTTLIDWDRCGVGPPLVDLAWYLAVNCDRLPETKEDSIAAYRAALEAAGVATSGWWHAQLRAALAGAFLQLAWSKNDDVAEFAWWSDRLDEAFSIT